MNTSNIQDTANGEQTRNTQHHEIRPADIVIGVIIGRTSEFFDFFVYAIASVIVFPKLIFSQFDPLTATLHSFVFFALAFIARPVGSIIFMEMDRVYGRGVKLISAILLLGTSTVAIGFLPAYEDVGAFAIILLAICRLGQGVAWEYREGNEEVEEEYDPDWEHSTPLELAIWSGPLLIIICLGAITWLGTHMLDPYRPLSRLSAGQPIPENMKTLEVEVVAMDWKWLFFYPEYKVASVNELAVPVNHPIHFRITSSTNMNAFSIPAMAGMIYAMAGMETPLHAVMNKTGTYKGLSANYSGEGFSHMNFEVHSLEKNDFNQWVATVKSEGRMLDRKRYKELSKRSINHPVTYYGSYDRYLYEDILNRCVDPDKRCMKDMMVMNMGAEYNDMCYADEDVYKRKGIMAWYEEDTTIQSPLSSPRSYVKEDGIDWPTLVVGRIQRLPGNMDTLKGEGLELPSKVKE